MIKREWLCISDPAVFVSALKTAALTNQHGHKNPTDPLFDHLLNLWFRALGHDSESVGVGHRSHGGSTQPGYPENRRDASHGDEEEQIKVETRTFHHLPLRFAHDQAGDPQRPLKETSSKSYLNLIHTNYFHMNVDCNGIILMVSLT